MQRPSPEKAWQIPLALVEPMPPAPVRATPLDVHAASYFAPSVKIFSFSSTVIAKIF